MVFLVSAALLFAAAAADPPPTPPAAAASAAAPQADKSKIVCKTQSVIGSRLPARICLTQEEWDQRAMVSRDKVQEIQRGQAFPNK